MEDPYVLLACGAAFAVSLLTLVALLVTNQNKDAESRLDSLSATGSSSRRSQSWRSRSVTASEESTNQMGSRLVQAGLYRRDSMAVYLGFKVGLTLIPVGIGLAAAMLGGLNLVQGILIGGVLGIAGTLLPSFYLDYRKRGRQTNIRRALPDALDVVVVCVEAGLSVPAALSRVAKELQAAHPLLAAEMLIVEREIQLGCTTGQAIKRLADRFDLAELRSLASVVLQAEKFGASISNALRVHAESLRTKRFQLAEERAQKASVKLLFPTIFCIFPALYVVLLGPAIFDIAKFLMDFDLLK